jgi:ribonuclease D
MKINFYENDIPANLTLRGDIAIDTETMGLNIARDRLCLMQMSDEAGNVHLVRFAINNYEAPNLKALLSNKSIVKIFHFARFDVAAINYYLNIKLVNIFCTKIASKLIRTYTDSHGLKELCRELLGVQLSKQQQSSDWGAQALSHEQKDYAAKDVIYLHKLRDLLTANLIRENRWDLFKRCIDFLPTIVELDLSGWNENSIFSH